MRAVVSKRGVDDGNQKGGGFPQPAQESHLYYKLVKLKIKFYLLSQASYYQQVIKKFFD